MGFIQFIFFFFMKVNPADGRDHGWERKQNHHLRGDQETMWWSHTQDETWWVSTLIFWGGGCLWSCTVWFVQSLCSRIYIMTMFILWLTKRFLGTRRSVLPFRDYEWIVLICHSDTNWLNIHKHLYEKLLVSFFSWPAMCIHGDKSQPERDWVLSGTTNTTTFEQQYCYVYFLRRCSAPNDVFFVRCCRVS